MPDSVGKTVEKKANEFQKFEARIAKCKHTAYVWNSSDLCLLPKVCFEKVKVLSKSVIDWIFKQKNYKSTRIDCPCDTKHNHRCQNDFCTTTKRVCNVFFEKKQEIIKSNIKSYYNKK
jgi:hypothetical protein